MPRDEFEGNLIHANWLPIVQTGTISDGWMEGGREGGREGGMDGQREGFLHPSEQYFSNFRMMGG